MFQAKLAFASDKMMSLIPNYRWETISTLCQRLTPGPTLSKEVKDFGETDRAALSSFEVARLCDNCTSRRCTDSFDFSEPQKLMRKTWTAHSTLDLPPEQFDR